MALWVYTWLTLAYAGALEDGITALREGRNADATRLLTAATTAAPENVDAWWQLGWADYAQKDFAGAVTAWEHVAKLDPNHAELSQWLPAARIRKTWQFTALITADVPTVADKQVTVTFSAGGDTMMGSNLKKGPEGVSPDSGKGLFVDSAAWFKAADVGFLNLEGPLADDLPGTKCAPNSTDCHAFRTPTDQVAALTFAGIDVVQLANNHAMDLGVPGMESTMKVLDAAGIAHGGRYGDLAIVERDGLKIAVVGSHSGSCCVNVNELDEVARAVQWADSQADLVVFAFHGGQEGASARHVTGKTEIAWGEPRGDVKALAHAAIDAGADLVIGTGPHVLRAMEVYRGRFVAYSLGNYTGYKQFGTGGGYGGTTVVLDVELAKNGVVVAAKLHPMALDASSVPHADPTGAGIAQINELSAADFPTTGVTVDADGTVHWK